MRGVPKFRAMFLRMFQLLCSGVRTGKTLGKKTTKKNRIKEGDEEEDDDEEEGTIVTTNLTY